VALCLLKSLVGVTYATAKVMRSKQTPSSEGGIPHHHFSNRELCELFQSAGFVTQVLDEKVSHKRYKGVARTQHRIVTVAQKPL
jgi:hypothetical protein